MAKRLGKAVPRELSSEEFQAKQASRVATAAELDAQLKILKAERHAATQQVEQQASLAAKRAALEKQLTQFCDAVWEKILKIANNAGCGYAESDVLAEFFARGSEKMGYTIDRSTREDA